MDRADDDQAAEDASDQTATTRPAPTTRADAAETIHDGLDRADASPMKRCRHDDATPITTGSSRGS